MQSRGKFAAVALCAFALAAARVGAVETQTWQQADKAEFEKGTLTRLSLSSNGRIALAPAVREVFDASVSFLWSVARDSRGNLYAGGGGLAGSDAKLFVIDPQGRGRLLASLEGISVQAIAVDRQDRVYAATSPDGKVYRVDASGKADVFYDPREKYIWAMAFSKSGDLFVATGDHGQIHRVTPAGAGSVFFRTEETHARSMALDANDNLIVGTEPSGLILRVTPAGEGFVLYQAPKREITAVAAAPDGSIYAAGMGNKQAVTTPIAPAPQAPPAAPAAAGTPVPNAAQAQAARPAQPAPAIFNPAALLAGGSEIYRILPDGYPRKVWSHPSELIYAFAFDSRGRVLAGSGNEGVLYRIDDDQSYTRLLEVEPTQITGLCPGPGGQIYAVTGNIGKVFAIGPDTENSGVFESEVLDAGGFSYWGRLMNEPQSSAGIVFETRSGNLDRAQRNWSPWARLSNGRIASPPARFLQYRATLSAAAELGQVYVAYQRKNVAPVIEQVEMTPFNYRFPAPPATPGAQNPTLSLPPLGRRNPTGPAAADGGATPMLTWAKGQMGVRWLANDENGDTLQFTVEIRGAGESTWKLVRDKVRERYLSWDSTAFPDGKYVVRITATDAPSTPPDQALSATRETEVFQIDNSPPEITGLAATGSGSQIELRFSAKDALSWIGKAEYSVNGGDWVIAEPTTRLTDSSQHDYRVSFPRPAGEVTIAVRVGDEYENQSVAKAVVK
jgi:hypothetical protein